MKIGNSALYPGRPPPLRFPTRPLRSSESCLKHSFQQSTFCSKTGKNSSEHDTLHESPNVAAPLSPAPPSPPSSPGFMPFPTPSISLLPISVGLPLRSWTYQLHLLLVPPNWELPQHLPHPSHGLLLPAWGHPLVLFNFSVGTFCFCGLTRFLRILSFLPLERASSGVPTQ